MLPLLGARAPAGLTAALTWAGRARGWNIKEAGIVFSVAALFIAGLLSGFVLINTLFGGNFSQPQWEENHTTYRRLEDSLLEWGARPADIVITTNPPGYFAAANRRAITTPDGGVQTLLAAAQRYGGKFLVLEENHPEGLSWLYANPQTHPDGLQYLTTVEGTHIFAIEGFIDQ